MKKKILHIALDMGIGGAQQVIRQLIVNLPKDEFDSEVLCLNGGIGELGESLSAQGVKLHTFDRKGIDLRLILYIRKLIKDNNYEIIHCHQYTPYFFGVLSSCFLAAAVVFTEHGRFFPDIVTLKRKILNPVLSLFTHKIVAISESTKEALVKNENFPRKAVSVIHNGVSDLQGLTNSKLLRDKLSIAPDNVIFGTVSRLQPIKNQKMMIIAFASILEKHPKSKLLIVGDGPSKADLMAFVDNFGIAQSVIFTGFKVNALAYTEIIDVFLLTSYSEGLSMALIEAMALSKPCIATNVGGNAELIENNLNGFIIESKDTAALIRASLALISKKQLRLDMGRESRRTYMEKFRVEQMVAKYECIYNEVGC